jgi:hypothetical protein
VLEAKKRILADVPNILESKYPEDELTELVDSDLPVYYSEIIYQWAKLPSEYEQPLSNHVITDETNIYSLMGFDLYDFYRDTYFEALEEIKKEKKENE